MTTTTDTATTTAIDLDSTRPDFRARAFDVYKVLRDEHPV